MSLSFDLEHSAGALFGDSPCSVREILGLMADKWSLHVVAVLSGRPMRFGVLRREVNGVSQRMLTLTLRNLERMGIVQRNVHSVMPPSVSYELTAMGMRLVEAVKPLIAWTVAELPEIAATRSAYDARQQAREHTA